MLCYFKLFDEAIECFKRAIDLNSNYSLAINNRNKAMKLAY